MKTEIVERPLIVSAGVVFKDGRIMLCQRRPEAHFDFAGADAAFVRRGGWRRENERRNHAVESMNWDP